MTSSIENNPSETTDVLVEDPNDLGETLPMRYSITSYGADYPVDSLVSRLKSGAIYVPSFQRGYVWKPKQASRFIESLLLGLPVPGIFLAREQEGSKLIVIDGQQRLKTLQFFFSGLYEPTQRAFTLDLSAPSEENPFHGLSYRTLSEDDKLRLNDFIIHATIIRQDQPEDGQSSIYSIFERLNTGGVSLEPQEIRASIYYGPLSDLLSALNDRNSWRVMFGPKHSRMRDQELILRFFALLYDRESYEPPMKGFLNRFMGRNRNLDVMSKEDLEKAFDVTIDLVNDHIGPEAFRPKRAINAAVFDAVMIGVAQRWMDRPITHPEDLKSKQEALMDDVEFQTGFTRATANPTRVASRIALATATFDTVR